MSRGIATTLAKRRFLLLTLLICAFLLTTPLIAGNWPVQLVLEALLFTQLYLCLITWDPASFSLCPSRPTAGRSTCCRPT